MSNNSTFVGNYVSSTSVGGSIYFLNNLSYYLPYVLLSLIGSLTGLLGNLLIIGTVISSKELHSPPNILIFNLAIADLIVSIFVEPFIVTGVFLGENFFVKYYNFCSFIASMCLLASVSSLINMFYLAFNRYIHICHSTIYNKWFTIQKTIIYCLTTWVIGIMFILFNLVGWGNFKYDTETLSCIWNISIKSYDLFFALTCIIIPCICITFCYGSIFWYYIKAHNKVSIENSVQERVKGNMKSFHVAKGLLLSFLFFSITWLPYGFVIMTGIYNDLSRGAYMFTMTIANLNSSINPILYGIYNSSLQKGYSDFLKKIFQIKPSQNGSKIISGLTIK